MKTRRFPDALFRSFFIGREKENGFCDFPRRGRGPGGPGRPHPPARRWAPGGRRVAPPGPGARDARGAAAGATALLDRFPISHVIFTGIAGGVADCTQVLDEVVATRLVEHDYGFRTR